MECDKIVKTKFIMIGKTGEWQGTVRTNNKTELEKFMNHLQEKGYELKMANNEIFATMQYTKKPEL